VTRTIGERLSYVSGVGQSVVGRRTGLSEMELTLQSVLAAMEDDCGLVGRGQDGGGLRQVVP
jgi:hypothetical protein